MDKYIEKLDIKTLVGKKFGVDNKFEIAAGKLEGEKLAIIIIENYENYDEKQKLALKNLKSELNNLSYDNILKMIDDCDKKGFSLRLIKIKIDNVFLRSNNKDICSITAKGDVIQDLLWLRQKEYKILSKKDIYNELYDDNFINDLRKVFAEIFGKDYKQELKNYYINLAKTNCENQNSKIADDENDNKEL